MSRRTPTHLAIEVMYRDHGHVVLRRAWQLLGNEDDARDVLHEVFTSLLARPEQFAGRSSIATWLYSATTHRCLNKLRSQRTRAQLLESQVVASPRAPGPSGEEMAELRRLLARLPDDLAQAAAHFCMDGMTYDEIAVVMGCSRRHVANLLRRVEEWTSEEPAPKPEPFAAEKVRRPCRVR